MTISTEIKQVKPFKSSKNKAMVNLIFTNNWMTYKQKIYLKEIGLSLETYNVLKILKGSSPKAVNINNIIERMLDKLSNASRLVDRLVLQGFAKRTVSSEDRRAVEVTITQEGLKILEKAEAEQEKFEISLNGLTEDESEILSELLDKFRKSN